MKKMYRSETDKVIAGVCGGLAEYFEVDPVLVRLLWIFFTLMGGSGVVVYFICWLVLPTQSSVSTTQTATFEQNAHEIADTSKKAAKAVETIVKKTLNKEETNQTATKTKKKSTTKTKTDKPKSKSTKS